MSVIIALRAAYTRIGGAAAEMVRTPVGCVGEAYHGV